MKHNLSSNSLQSKFYFQNSNLKNRITSYLSKITSRFPFFLLIKFLWKPNTLFSSKEKIYLPVARLLTFQLKFEERKLKVRQNESWVQKKSNKIVLYSLKKYHQLFSINFTIQSLLMKWKSKNRMFNFILAFALMSITQCNLVAQSVYTYYEEDTGITYFVYDRGNTHKPDNYYPSSGGLGAYEFNAKEEEKRAAEQKAQAEKHAEDSRRFVKEEQEKQAAREEEWRLQSERHHEELQQRLKQEEEHKRQIEQETRAKRAAAEKTKVEPEECIPFRSATAEEIDMLSFDKEYLNAYGSRFEKVSGFSLEQIIANRNSLIQQGEQIDNNLISKIINAGKWTKRPGLRYSQNKLHKAISRLKKERDRFITELEREAQAKRDEAIRQAAEEKAKAEGILKEQREYAEILDFEADSSHLVQKLENFNTLFTGLQAPNIESFNNLMASFMGKDLSAANNAPSDLSQEFKNLNALFENLQVPNTGSLSDLFGFAAKDLFATHNAANTIPVDSNIVGDYILTSFKYHDEKADVNMEIGRIIKIDDCVMSSDTDMNWDKLSEGYFDVTGINVSQQSQEVIFALQEGSDKVILKTDLNSMSNYIAQKTIEGYIFFDPNAVYKTPVDFDKIPTYGLENSNPTFARQAASIIVDFIPWIGTTKSISELIFGYDPISGERIHRVVAAFGVVTSIVPIPGAAKAGKLVGKALVMTTDFLGKKSNHVIEKNFTRLVKSIPREAPEILKKFRPQYEAVKAFSEAGYKGASKYYILIEDRIVHAGENIKQLAPRIQERLKHMRIPDKPLVPGGGLLRHELYKGNHSLRDHVGYNETNLLAFRAAGRKGDLSSFNNLEKAEYFVAETIRENQSEIQQWLKTEKPTQRFILRFKQTTGILLKKEEQSIRNVKRVRVVLKQAKETPEGYTVYTTFPVE